MRTQTYLVIVALLLVFVFLLWPRGTDRVELLPPERLRPEPEVVPSSNPPAFPSAVGETADRRRPIAQTAPDIAETTVTSESPPAETAEWRVARQEAMLTALKRHIEMSETKRLAASDPVEREKIEQQLEILRSELGRQQEELFRLREWSGHPTTMPLERR